MTERTPSGDVVARMDQAVEESRQIARPIAAFYKTLVDEGGMDATNARIITYLYAYKALSFTTRND